MKIFFSLLFLTAISSPLFSQNSFPATGNVLIGTTTDNGTLLQLNGNATFNGRLQLNGSSGLAVLSGLRPVDNAVMNLMSITDQSTLRLGGGNQNYVDIYAHTYFVARFSTGLGGSMGLGVATPTAQLHTSGSVRFAGILSDNTQTRVLVSDVNGNIAYRDVSTIGGGSGTGWLLNGTTVGAIKSFGTIDNFDIPIITNNTEKMRIGANGSVGIGTVLINDVNYKLFVENGIRTRKIKVDQGTWPDYVFAPDYQRPSLNELENYIRVNKHLPGMISEDQVKNEGVDLGDNQAALLKQIETLTLYIIEQNKKQDLLQQELKTLETQVQELKKQKRD